MPKILLRLLLCIGLLNTPFSTHTSRLDDSEPLSVEDAFDKFNNLPLTIFDPLRLNASILSVSRKKSLDVFLKQLQSPYFYRNLVNNHEYPMSFFLLITHLSYPKKTPHPIDIHDQLVDALEIFRKELSFWVDEHSSDLKMITTFQYPSMSWIRDIDRGLPKQYWLLTQMVLNLHMLLHHKALLQSGKMAMLNGLFPYLTMLRYMYYYNSDQFYRLKQRIKRACKMWYDRMRGNDTLLSNQTSVYELFNVQDFLDYIRYINSVVFFGFTYLRYKPLISNTPLLKLYVPIINMFLLRNHNFNPKLKKLEIGLNAMSYLVGLSIDRVNQSFILPKSIKTVIRLAKQEKATIDNYSQALSEVCHALQHGNFIEKCCPPSWQDLKSEEVAAVSKTILEYTYEAGKDYKVMDLQNSDEKMFSFFDAPDDDRATDFFMSMRKKENKLAKYTARAATLSLGIFASYSIWKFFNKKSMLA